MSHKTTVRLINQMGKFHDRAMLEWQSELLSVLIAQVCNMYQLFIIFEYFTVLLVTGGGGVSNSGACSCSRQRV